MFDTIAGLPLHPLVVHAVVVLLPLMALLTVVVAVRKNLREQFSWWVVGANGVIFLTTLVAKEAGESLQKSLGGQVAQEHGELGSVLPWFALFLTLASAATAVANRNKALGPDRRRRLDRGGRGGRLLDRPHRRLGIARGLEPLTPG